MPLYEYQCDACGHRFEVIQKFSDAPVETCPSCGAKVHKLQSAPAIQFKGTGWYITDYAKKEHVAATKAEHALRESSDAKPKTDTAAPASDPAPSSSPAPAGSSSKKDS